VAAKLCDGGRLSRADLVELTTLSAQALAVILNELEKKRVVVEVAVRSASRGRGRPALLYEFNADRFCVASLYIGLRYCEIALCDGRGRPVAAAVEYQPGWDPEVIVEQTAAQLERLRAEAGVADRPCNLAVVTHGTVEASLGEVSIPDMAWDAVPIAGMLEARCGLDVVLVEGSRAAAAAESREGAAVGCRRATVFNLGPVATAALVVDGEVDQGASGRAGMIGRCVVVTSQGADTVDRLAGSFASKKRYNERTDRQVEWVTEVYRRAREGEAEAVAVVDLQVEVFAFAATWVVAIDDPERLVFTGAIGDFPESHRARLHTSIAETSDFVRSGRTSVHFSSLGRQAWIRGGVHFALDRQRAIDPVWND